MVGIGQVDQTRISSLAPGEAAFNQATFIEWRNGTDES